jgi:hypothetical protein
MTILKVCLRAATVAVFMLFAACAFAQTEINPDHYDVFVNTPATSVQKPSPQKLNAMSRQRGATAPKAVSGQTANKKPQGNNVAGASGQKGAIATRSGSKTPQTKKAAQKKLVASGRKHPGAHAPRLLPGP